MEYNGIQFLRPDPFLAEGITFLRHDPDWRPYYIPLQTRLTKRHSGLTLFASPFGLGLRSGGAFPDGIRRIENGATLQNLYFGPAGIRGSLGEKHPHVEERAVIG